MRVGTGLEPPVVDLRHLGEISRDLGLGVVGSVVGVEGLAKLLRGGGALPPEHPLRTLCISAVETATLERAVLFAILSNCLFMAAQGPPERYGFLPAEMSEKVELGYTLFFTVGALLPLVHARRAVVTAADPAEASRPSPTRRQSSCSRSWRSAWPATPSPTWPTGGTASTWWWWWRLLLGASGCAARPLQAFFPLQRATKHKCTNKSKNVKTRILNFEN